MAWTLVQPDGKCDVAEFNRGPIDYPVPQHARSVVIPLQASDTSYVVQGGPRATGGWATSWWVVSKTVSSVTIGFSAPAPANAFFNMVY